MRMQSNMHFMVLRPVYLRQFRTAYVQVAHVSTMFLYSMDSAMDWPSH